MANSYLNKTIGTPSNADKMTISVWVKRSKLSSSQVILGDYADADNRSKLRFRTDDQLEYFQEISNSTNIQVKTNRVFRDTSAWYHILVQIDTSLATANDRIKFYINGIQESAANLTYSTAITQNQDIRINTSGLNLQIGQSGNSNEYFEGYISHIALVDNAIVAPTSFGETDSTSGIWKFKSPSGITWGNNGFHLKFENSAALGTDSSGNSNTFTVNGNLKQALDTPSNVYATFNPLDNYYPAMTLSYGNTRALTYSGKYTYTPTTLGMTSGKYYAEIKCTAQSGSEDYMTIGITSTSTGATTHELGHYANDWGYHGNDGSYNNNDGTTSYGAAFTTGDIIGIAVDLDNNKLYFHKNGTYQNSGVPTSGSTGTGAISITDPASTPRGAYFFAVNNWSGSTTATFDANFGNGYFGTTAITSAGSNGNGSLFEYDVPSGYYALNTKNLNTYG